MMLHNSKQISNNTNGKKCETCSAPTVLIGLHLNRAFMNFCINDLGIIKLFITKKTTYNDNKVMKYIF